MTTRSSWRLQAGHLLVDGAAVGLDLRLAGTADEAKAAALPLKVGPGADQTRALVGQGRQFDLQHAFTGAGAVGEDLQDQPGPVQKLDAPFLFQVALLHRRHRAVHQHQLDLGLVQPLLDLGQLALAEQLAGIGLAQVGHFGADHLDAGQRQGQRDGFGQGMLGLAPLRAGAAQVGVDHIGAGRFRFGRPSVRANQSSPS